jgi:hypothetical protein
MHQVFGGFVQIPLDMTGNTGVIIEYSHAYRCFSDSVPYQDLSGAMVKVEMP